MKRASTPRVLRVLGCLLLGGILPACAAFERGRQIPVTPQRPTFSNDAFTTAEGTFELEAGVALDIGDRLGTPSTVKLGLDERSEAFLGLEPLVIVDGNEVGIGDLVLGYQRRFAEATEDRPALAWLAALKLPTADEDDGIGSGEFDVFGSLAASWVGPEWSSTGYAQLALLGDPGGGSAFQFAGALAMGRPLEDDLAAFGELAAILTPEFDDEQLFVILGLAWTRVPGQVFDFGVQLGLSEDAPDFQLFIGTTSNTGPAPTGLLN